SESEAVTAVLGKHAQFATVLSATVLEGIKAGKLRALVQLSERRDVTLPDVTTPSELGITGFQELKVVNSFFAPQGTPPEVVKQLAVAIHKAQRDPVLVDKLAKLGMVPFEGGPTEVRFWLQ